jgi:hypothetical protein
MTENELINLEQGQRKAWHLRGKRFTVCTEIAIIFTIRGGRLRYKRYDAHFLKKSSVELPFSSFGDHLKKHRTTVTVCWYRIWEIVCYQRNNSQSKSMQARENTI